MYRLPTRPHPRTSPGCRPRLQLRRLQPHERVPDEPHRVGLLRVRGLHRSHQGIPAGCRRSPEQPRLHLQPGQRRPQTGANRQGRTVLSPGPGNRPRSPAQLPRTGSVDGRQWSRSRGRRVAGNVGDGRGLASRTAHRIGLAGQGIGKHRRSRTPLAQRTPRQPLAPGRHGSPRTTLPGLRAVRSSDRHVPAITLQ